MQTGDVETNGTADGASGFQTVALIPNQSGGYMLVVQQPGGGDGTQVQLPAAAASALLSGAGILSAEEDKDGADEDAEMPPPPPTRKRNARSARIKQEKDTEKANDINIYDFEDGNLYCSTKLGLN